jgi:hypothetical protein
MSCTSSRTKPHRSTRAGIADDEDDAETLRKAAAWRERLDRAEADRVKRRSEVGGVQRDGERDQGAEGAVSRKWG